MVELAQGGLQYLEVSSVFWVKHVSTVAWPPPIFQLASP